MALIREFLLSKFYLIESLSSNEIKTGRRLYEELIHHNYEVVKQYMPVDNKPALFDAIEHVKAEAQTQGHYPIIHLEMHGSEEGIQFSSGDVVHWPELYHRLMEINTLVRNNLVLTLAVCRGAFLSEITHPTNRSPFLGLIAPVNEAFNTDLLRGFTAFYQELFSSADVDVALDKLRSYNLEGYTIIDASILFDQVYEHYRQTQLTPEAVKRRIDAIINKLKAVGVIPGRLGENDARTFAQHSIAVSDQDNYETMRDRFLMIDIYPENRDRF